MRFRQQWRRLLATAAAAVVTAPLSLLAPLSPGSAQAATPAARPAPAAAPQATEALSDLDATSEESAFVRESGSQPFNAEKAQFAAEGTADGQFPAIGDRTVAQVTSMTGSSDIGGPAEWQRSDAPAQPACLDGGPPTATGDGDADASTAAPATDPDESPDSVARRRAAWYRADVDTAFHVPIRDMQQETDA